MTRDDAANRLRIMGLVSWLRESMSGRAQQRQSLISAKCGVIDGELSRRTPGAGTIPAARS
jgi:hypothetical protein